MRFVNNGTTTQVSRRSSRSQLAAGVMLPGPSRSISDESAAVGTMDEVDTRRADSNKQASTTYVLDVQPADV